ncbi:secreted protein [Melampsora americana]|nr:secreted protein [Melampsora americana]
MHLFTYATSLMIAAVVASSSLPMTSADSVARWPTRRPSEEIVKTNADPIARLTPRHPSEQIANVKTKDVKMMCFGGCGGMGGIPFNPAVGFVQPMIFNTQVSFSNFAAFGTACASTLAIWQGIQSFQIIQQQFQMMIVSMATLIAPFQSGCGICVAGQSSIFIQTITQVIIQVQSLVTIIFTQFGPQIALFQNEFAAMGIFFQTVIGIGMTMGVNMQQVFLGSQFNFQMFQTCGIPVQTWFNGGFAPSFLFQQVGLLGQILTPIVGLLQPVVNGLGSVLTGLGLGLGNLLGGHGGLLGIL